MPIGDFVNPVVNTGSPRYYYTTTAGDATNTVDPLAHVGPLEFNRYQQAVTTEASQLDITSLISMIDTKIEIAMKEQQQNLYRIISEHCGIDISMDEFIKLLQGK